MGDPRRKLTTVGHDGLAWHRDGDPWHVPVDGSWVELGRDAGLNYSGEAGMIPPVSHASDTNLSLPRVCKTPRSISARISSFLCKQKNLQLVTEGVCVCLVSLVFTVKLFKTNLDVATLFFPIML